MERSSGILLHVTSLPGPHGIGDLGPEAYRWIDQLAGSRQSWWQVLPLGPTGYGDSPYQCYSAFAGNPNLISLERLAEEGLLTPADLPRVHLPIAEVDYDRVRPQKLEATAAAFEQFKSSVEFERFCREAEEWLDDYALFLAIKEQN